MMQKNVCLCLLMVGFISASIFAAGGNLPGYGTESSPYLIEDMDDFDIFTDPNYGSPYWAEGVYSRLEFDPNLAGRTYNRALIAPDENYMSSSGGYIGTAFAGVFDGNGHHVLYMNIYVNEEIDGLAGSNGYVGMFGKVTGEVRNLSVHGTVDVNAYRSNCLGRIGGFAGNIYGSSGTTIIDNCHFVGDVIAEGRWIGGFCGSVTAGNTSSVWIRNCTSSGNVEGLSWTYLDDAEEPVTLYSNIVGGFVGSLGANVLIASSCSSCDIVAEIVVSGAAGGFIGSMSNESGGLYNCTSNCSIICNKDGAQIGGLVGSVGTNNSIQKCTANVDIVVSGTKLCVGGLVGSSGSGVSYSKAIGEISVSSSGNMEYSEHVGGLVGSGGRISQSYSEVDIDVAYNVFNETFSMATNIGGLAGTAGPVTNCYAVGSITGSLFREQRKETASNVINVGGLIGQAGDIENSYCAVELLLVDPNDVGIDPNIPNYRIGAFCGELDGSSDCVSCYWDSDEEAQYYGIGFGSSTEVIESNTFEMQSQVTYLDDGWDFDGYTINGEEAYWFMPETTYSYPILTWEVMEARWTFDSSDVAVISPYAIADSSDHYHLIASLSDGYTSDAAIAYVDGKVDTGMKFTRNPSDPDYKGNDDYFVVEGYKGITGNQERTFSVWIDPNDSHAGVIASWGNGEMGNSALDGQLFAVVVVEYGNINPIQVSLNHGCDLIGSIDVCDGLWHHVAVVFDPSVSNTLNGVKIYIDGELDTGAVANDTTTVLNTGDEFDVMIGRVQDDVTTSELYYEGSVDDVRLYDIALSASQVRQMFLQYGTQADWKLDSNFVEDFSGNDFDGTKNGSFTIDGYAELDGVEDFIEVADYKGVTGAQARTFSTWIEPSESHVGVLASWGNGEMGNSALDGQLFAVVVVPTSNGVNIQVTLNHGCDLIGSIDVCDGLWHHVAVVFDPSVSSTLNGVKIYIDGELDTGAVANDTTTVLNTGDEFDVMIGRVQDGVSVDSFNYYGSIDDVRIYDNAMSEYEIAELAIGYF